MLENDRAYLNPGPFVQPQLGKHGLYPATGGEAATNGVMSILWTLAYSDGETSLLNVAERADFDFDLVRRAAGDLARAGLLAPTPSGPPGEVAEQRLGAVREVFGDRQ